MMLWSRAKLFAGSGVMLYKCVDPISELTDPSKGAQEKLIDNVLEAGELVPIKIICEADDLSKGLVLLEKFRRMTVRG